MNSKIKDYAESDTLYRLLEEIIEISNRTNIIKSDLKREKHELEKNKQKEREKRERTNTLKQQSKNKIQEGGKKLGTKEIRSILLEHRNLGLYQGKIKIKDKFSEINKITDKALNDKPIKKRYRRYIQRKDR